MSANVGRRGLANQDASTNNPRQRRLRRGERRRLTREDINADIKRKEEELAKLLETRNGLKKSQRDQRAATLVAYREKDQNQLEVDRSYKEISAKSEEMNRIKTQLIYQRADRHDDAIRRIENQLSVNNFKLSDEKRLVQEIDSLRKSKRDLSKYQQMRSSLDEIRARQRIFKAQRNAFFEKIKVSKRKEDHLKQQVDELLPAINQLKHAIEELQQRRQQLEVCASSSSGDEGCLPAEGDRSEAAGPGGGGAGGEGAGEPAIGIEFEDFDDSPEADNSDSQEHITLCRSLIVYLRNLLPDWATVAAGGDLAASAGAGAACRPSPPSRLSLPSPSFAAQQAFPFPSPSPGGATAAGPAGGEEPPPTFNLLSPSASAAAVSALSGPNALAPEDQLRRRPLGRKLQRSERVLNHKPEVFAQFDLLGMQPPSRVVEIPDSIQKLNAYLDAKEAESADAAAAAAAAGGREKSPTATVEPAAPGQPPVGYARSLSNPSNDESGFSETTSVRPESPELGASSRVPPQPLTLSQDTASETEVASGMLASAAVTAASGHDDLLSTSSTICSEDNAASSTESPPLPAS